MLLEWIWASVFLIAGMATIVRGVYLEHRDSSHTGADYMRGALVVFLLMFSALSVYETCLLPLRAWFSRALPDHGTDIHDFTSFALTVGVVVIYVMAVVYATALPVDRWMKRRTLAKGHR